MYTKVTYSECIFVSDSMVWSSFKDMFWMCVTYFAKV